MKDNQCLPTPADEAEPYSSFADLLKNEMEGRDFIRLLQVRESQLAIVAPHGGGVEPGTSEIAKAIAGDEYSFYCFDSLKTNGNEIMHITSHDFDDPLCISLARSAQIVVSIHGCCDEQSRVFVGGRHDNLSDHLLASLLAAGFEASYDDGRHPGKHIDNVCNLGQSGAGIQLEISLGLRRTMFSGMSRVERRITCPPFHRFIDAVRKVLKNIDISSTTWK
jgi:phage replication-related protein YjqB (UPF0714/DUF867 family)